MKKLVKKSENKFNTVEAFKGCKCKSCSCSCWKWWTKGTSKNSTKDTNQYFSNCGL